MDLNVEDPVLNNSSIYPQENTLVNDSSNIDDTDPTLTADESSSFLSLSANDGVSEENLHANLNPDSDEPSSYFEVELSKKADNIVGEIIDSASLSLRSSGDFSLLNDSETLNITEAAQDPSAIEESMESNIKDTKEKKDEWMDILGNGLLKKKVLEPGQGVTSRPERGQEVTIKIEAYAKDGSTIELSKTITFIIADFDLPEGIDMAVNLMEKGEKCQLESDAKYCQPKDGQPSLIPKQGKVVFHIELLEIEDGPYNTSVAIVKRLSWVDAKRKLGNHLYSRNMLEEAKQAYTKCNRVLRQAANQEQTDEIKEKINDFTMKCHNNLAATLIKLHNWKDALQACLVAERIDGNNIKTLFRKGTICSKLGQYKHAIVALKKAVSLSPEDKTLQKELSKYQKRQEQQNQAQKLMYRRMMGGAAKNSEPKPDANKGSWFSTSSFAVGSSLLVLGTAILVGVYIMHR